MIVNVTSARERFCDVEFLSFVAKGQQIRCDSEADGYSPDDRERDKILFIERLFELLSGRSKFAALVILRKS